MPQNRSTRRSSSSRGRTTASARGEGRSKASGPSAIEVLKKDHEKVRELLDSLTKAKEGRKREKLLDQIEQEVKVHSQLEEEIFYPAFRDLGTKEAQKLFYESTEEHHVVDLVLPEIRETDPDSNEFAGKAKVLKDLIEHHAEEEEKEMFPQARKKMSAAELKELGARIEERRGEIQGL